MLAIISPAKPQFFHPPSTTSNLFVLAKEVTIVDNGNGTSTETKKTWKYTITTKNWKRQDFEWITTEEKKKEKFRKIKERTQTWTYKYLDNSTEDIVQEKETEVVQNWEPRQLTWIR